MRLDVDDDIRKLSLISESDHIRIIFFSFYLISSSLNLCALRNLDPTNQCWWIFFIWSFINQPNCLLNDNFLIESWVFITQRPSQLKRIPSNKLTWEYVIFFRKECVSSNHNSLYIINLLFLYNNYLKRLYQ